MGCPTTSFTNVFGQPNYLEDVYDTTFRNRSAKTFLRVSKLQKHKQETLFHRREDSTRIKERSGVNSPLDELVMVTLCSWTVLDFEGNLTKAGKAIRKPAESR